MKVLRLLAMALCSVLFLGILSLNTNADEWNKKTVFTFNTPVEVPGFKAPLVLPPGTYVFKLLDSKSDRDIVQVFNKDETHLYTTILAIPDYRMKPKGKTVITFSERAAGSPQAVKAWFYPGDLFGQEFVYPNSRAVQLAKSTNEPVLSMPEQSASNMDQASHSAKEPAVQALEQTPVKAEKPSGEEVESGEVVQSTPPANPTVAQNQSPKLPKTGSDMPLAALLGALLIGLGIGTKLLYRRSA